MLPRLVFLTIVGLFSMFAVTSGIPSTGPAGQLLVPRQADAAASIGPLMFSSEMTADFQPAGLIAVYFERDNNGVFVTFTYTDLPPNSRVTRIVRVNEEDFNWEAAPYLLSQCCPQGGNGRYGFRVVRETGEAGEIPGGAYEVVILLNGVQAQIGGFGVKGTGGLDNGNDNS